MGRARRDGGQGVVLLGGYRIPEQTIFATFEIASLADLNGHKIRATSPDQGRFIEEFGGAPITLSGSKVPISLERGVIEGVLTASAGGAKKWGEFLPYNHRFAVNYGNSMIFAYATALSGVGEHLVSYLEDANVSRRAFLLIVMVVFAILGCFMEGLGMVAIIVPVIYPALLALNVDPIWFGVFVVILIELGQLIPPLGVILFVVAISTDTVKVEDVILGTLPFFGIILAFLQMMIAFPQIALFLPSLTFG